MIPVYCVTMDKKGERAQRTVKEFSPYGITPTMFRGINAIEWGIMTCKEMHHNGGIPYFINPSVCGCTISHWMLWNHLLISKIPEAMIVEDDVQLCDNFLEKFLAGYAELPQDWTYALVGHCCAGGKPATQVTARIWDIRWPMCNHCYLVKGSGIEALMDGTAELRAPIDIALNEKVFMQNLGRAYTFMPRLALQYDTFLHD